MTTETEWRAVEEKTLGYWFVAEFRANGTVARIIVYSLDEPTARLIAAAPAKERLCEELAKILRDWLMLTGLSSETYWSNWDEIKARAQAGVEQEKAGRAPQ